MSGYGAAVRTGARSRRTPAALRLFLVLGVVAALLVATGAAIDHLQAPPRESPAAAALPGPAPWRDLAAAPGAPGPDGDPGRRTLVLYNDSGGSAELSLSDAIQTANLASSGGAWEMRPVERYERGAMDGFQAVVYVGRETATPLPRGFLSDVADGAVPVLWMGANIDQLFEREARAVSRYGWRPGGEDPVDVPVVEYGGQDLLRATGTTELLTRVELEPGGGATVLGTARHADGSGYPWAVRSGLLTYVGEVPFSYVDTRDRYLAAADLIGRLVAPDAPDRKRALIRIEDVGPNTDPEQIRGIADLLSARGVPFTLATYPYYRDPLGAVHQGEPVAFRLVDAPDLVDALRYATERGATIIMHGYSHQFGAEANPYNGTSGADYEFYRAHVDAQDVVRLDGPVPGDSRAWAADRFATGRAEFVRAGLPDPTVFEFPHYTASAVDYQAVHDVFGVRYDQGTYFTSLCPDGRCAAEGDAASTGLFQQYFPYPVRDVYGSVVIPENCGNIAEAFNDNEARTAEDVVAAARAMTVVRGGVASAFFHPFLPLADLEAIVTGFEAEGYRFVAPREMIGPDAGR